VEGEEGVRSRHDNARRYSSRSNGKHEPRRFPLVPFDKVTVGSERVYLVKGIIPRTGLIVVWGPFKCGKSFWTFDLVMHVALGWPYRGRRVQQGVVVYLSLEGSQAARITAFRLERLADHKQAVPFYLASTSINLIKDHADLIESIRDQIDEASPAVVVIDTLNRSLVGSESSDEDMAAYVRAADAIQAAFGCAVIIVHHCGIEGTRPRGHSSLTGAADAQLAVRRDALDNINVEVEWMKDGPEGDVVSSRLKVVNVGKDVDGDELTSCVIEPVENAVVSNKDRKKKRMPNAAMIALDALMDAISELGEPAPASNHIPANVRVVSLRHWRDFSYRRGISDGEVRAKQQAFKRAKEYLIAAKQVSMWDDHVWIAR
jgi:hypothetical protein